MQAVHATRIRAELDLRTALPLYAASLLVTLAGVGAVGVTITANVWLPIWATLTVLGHAVSLWLRRLRVPAEAVFYPVMLLGGGIALHQLITGSPLTGLSGGLFNYGSDMGVAVLVAGLAVVRTFTLISNISLLFSAVPAISMLALAGTSNPNAEIPLFFGLMLLGTLFLTGYEAQLRKAEAVGRPAGPYLYHLLVAWILALVVCVVGLSFPYLLQPAISPLSPFGLTGLARMRAAVTLTDLNQSQTQVGAGPITLAQTPVFEVYTDQPGLMRSHTYSHYTGRSWVQESPPHVTDVRSEEKVPLTVEVEGQAVPAVYTHYRFRFPPDASVTRPLRKRTVTQRVVTRLWGVPGIPTIGRIRELRYPRSTVYEHVAGTLTGSGHMMIGRIYEAISEVKEPSETALRRAPPVDPRRFFAPEALQLPPSSRRVQAFAREVTAGIENPYDRVRTILDTIERRCRYSLLEEVTPPGVDATEHYLFTTRRGACDLSATSAIVMCRAVGVPARAVVGYLLDEPLPRGRGYLIRQQHAHMWLEVFFPGYGWVEFNPSPPLASMRDHPVQALLYALQSQLSKIGGGGLDAVLLVVMVLATAALVLAALVRRLRALLAGRRRRGRSAALTTAQRLTAIYARARQRLRRAGWGDGDWQTPRELLATLQKPWAGQAEAREALATLTRLHEEAAYAERVAAASLDEARSAERRLTRCLPRAPRRRQEEGAPTIGSPSRQTA